MPYPYILLDRDGTLIENVPYLSNWKQVKFLPGIVEDLEELKYRNFHFGIVSNQSGIGRRLIQYKQLLEVNSHILEVLNSRGITLDFFFCCLHRPDEGCQCRKPQTGLIDKSPFADKILRPKSFMVGDSISDIQFGINLGIRPIMVGTKDMDFSYYSLENVSSLSSLIANLDEFS